MLIGMKESYRDFRFPRRTSPPGANAAEFMLDPARKQAHSLQAEDLLVKETPSGDLIVGNAEGLALMEELSRLEAELSRLKAEVEECERRKDEEEKALQAVEEEFRLRQMIRQRKALYESLINGRRRALRSRNHGPEE